MATFSMTCSCGHTMSIDAPDRETAVAQMQAGMTQEALDEHLRQNHADDAQKPTLEQTKAIIAQALVAA